MRRQLNPTAAIGWCLFAVIALLIAGCSSMEAYVYCGAPPCETGSTQAMSNPSLCLEMNKSWAECRRQHGPPGQSSDISSYWISGTVVGPAPFRDDWLRVVALYRDRDAFKETAHWSELKQGFATWIEWCQSQGAVGVGSAKRVISVESFKEEDRPSRCKKPDIIPGKPEAIWCVQCREKGSLKP